MNRFFRGSTALLPFWQSGVGLSFVALFWKDGADGCNSVGCGFCGVRGVVASTLVSGLKSREGPFVDFRKVFEFGDGIFKDCRIFESFKSVSMGTILFDTVKIYEGSVV